MPSAQALYAESIADVTAATTYVNVCTISAGSFTGSAKYLILAIADLSGSGSANEHYVRLQHGGVNFTDGEFVHDPGQGADGGQIYSWMYVFTQPSSPEAVALDIKGESTGVATSKFGQIVAINLDNIGTENTDWYYNEVTADYTTTTTPTAQASITFTPNGTDDWLVIGHAVQGKPSVVADGNSAGFEIHNSVTGTVNPKTLAEYEDVDLGDEIRGFIGMRVYTPTNVSHTFSVRPYHVNASCVFDSSRIFALKLNKFAQKIFSYTDGAVTPGTAGNWTTVASVSFTPSVTGNWFFLSQVILDLVLLNNETNFRLQHNDSGSLVSDPNYGDDSPNPAGWDSSDDLPMGMMKMRSMTSGAIRTVNFDATQAAGTSAAVKQRSIVAFSLELASSGQTGSVNQVLESDLAQPAYRIKTKLLGLVSEHLTVFMLGKLKTQFLGQSTELDEAQFLSSAKRSVIGQVNEVELALLVGRVRRQFIELINGSDAVQPLVGSKLMELGLAEETDLPLLLSHPSIRLLGFITELNSTFSISAVRQIFRAMLGTYRTEKDKNYETEEKSSYKTSKKRIDLL